MKSSSRRQMLGQESFMRSFVDRQIVDWSSPVDRQRPRTSIYGSHRIILSTDVPQAEADADKWHISHWITLNSKQLVTNVGRGGNLDLFCPRSCRTASSSAFAKWPKLAGAYGGPTSYEVRAAEAYGKTGCEVGRFNRRVLRQPALHDLDFSLPPICPLG